MAAERPSDDELNWLLDRLEERFAPSGHRAEPAKAGGEPVTSGTSR